MYSLAEGVVHTSLTFIVILLLLFLNDNLKVHSIHFLYIKKKIQNTKLSSRIDTRTGKTKG